MKRAGATRTNAVRSADPKTAGAAPAAAFSAFSFDDYDNVVGFVVSQAAFRLSSALARAIAAEKSDLRPREFAVLNRLHQFGQLTQVELASLTYKDKPAVTRMLDRLIERGLVRKQISASDRRAYLVSLTPKGEALRDAIVPRAVGYLEQACVGVRARDLEITVATLRTISDRL
ncbi:MAG: MarR family transcriptional regulator [Myxococcota bacterium]